MGPDWPKKSPEAASDAVRNASDGVTALLRLATKLVEVGALEKPSGHGVPLRLRSAAQGRKRPTANLWDEIEVDSVLPADPVV
jgi:hypothetical protein